MKVLQFKPKDEFEGTLKEAVEWSLQEDQWGEKLRKLKAWKAAYDYGETLELLHDFYIFEKINVTITQNGCWKTKLLPVV